MKEPSLLNGQNTEERYYIATPQRGWSNVNKKNLEKDKATIKQSTFRIRSRFNQDNYI